MLMRRPWKFGRRAERPAAITLIELLVVVAIIALLLATLLPSLNCAKAAARAAVCGTQLRGFGTGMTGYFVEQEGWIPGVNTSGFSLLQIFGASPQHFSLLRNPRLPVQTFDWMSPILPASEHLGVNRAERFQALLNRYACPEQRNYPAVFYEDAAFGTMVDKQDFLDRAEEEWLAVSYLMPALFQYWGQREEGSVIGFGQFLTQEVPVSAVAGSENWDVIVDSYRSKVQNVGLPARKIAVADGTRFLPANGPLDFNAHYKHPQDKFGSFTDGGAWWSGSEAYGVKNNTENWNGLVVNAGPQNPESQGAALELSYRHGCVRGAGLSGAAAQNRGSINALFFDGHIERLNDRESRNIVYWYPRGARVQDSSEAMTVEEVGLVVP